MIESKVPLYLMNIILSYLDHFSLRDYDTAMCNKDNRPIFLESLQCIKYNIACRWKILRNIRSTVEYSSITNVKYISDICEKLIIYSIIIRYKKINKIDLMHNNIKILHIDLDNHDVIVNSIRCKNLETLMLCNVQKVNVKVFNSLTKNCPNLKKISLVYCSKIFATRDLLTIIGSDKIKLYIRNRY